MKKNNLIITGVASLVALIAITGLAMSTFASEGVAENDTSYRKMGAMQRNMSEEDRLAWEAEREARRAEVEARQAERIAALEASDYDAWAEAIGENSPMLDKINEDNFPSLVEAYSLREEARVIMEGLGVRIGDFRQRIKGGGFRGRIPR